MVQEALIPRLAVQVVSAGTRAYEPERASARPVAAWRPVFPRVKAWAALVLPTGVAGKESEPGVAPRVMGEEPRPVSATVAEAGMALVEETVRVALSVPTTEGVNVI